MERVLHHVAPSHALLQNVTTVGRLISPYFFFLPPDPVLFYLFFIFLNPTTLIFDDHTPQKKTTYGATIGLLAGLGFKLRTYWIQKCLSN